MFITYNMRLKTNIITNKIMRKIEIRIAHQILVYHNDYIIYRY